MQVEDGVEVTVTSVCLKNAAISLKIQQPATRALIGFIDVVVFSFPEITIRHLPPARLSRTSPCTGGRREAEPACALGTGTMSPSHH